MADIHDRRLPYVLSEVDIKFFEKEVPDAKLGTMVLGMALVMDTGTSRQVTFWTKQSMRAFADALILFLDQNPRTATLTVATELPKDGQR